MKIRSMLRCHRTVLWIAFAFVLIVTGALPAQTVGSTAMSHEDALSWLSSNRNNPQLQTVLLAAIESAPSLDAINGLVREYLPLISGRRQRAAVMYRVGIIQELANSYGAARFSYSQALEDDPMLWDAAIRRAALAIEEGAVSEAVLLLTRVINQAPTRSVQRRAAILRTRSLLIGGEVDRAFQHAAALAGYVDGGNAGPPTPADHDLVEPAAIVLLYEASEAVDNDAAQEWCVTTLQERGAALPEALLIGDRPSETVQYYPSPSRILGGIAQDAQTSRPGVVRTDEETRPVQDAPPTEDTKQTETVVRGIQTGSFRDPENAQYMAEDIRALGFDAEVVAAEMENGTFYRVLVPVPPPATPEDAQRRVVELKERGIEGFLVIDQAN